MILNRKLLILYFTLFCSVGIFAQNDITESYHQPVQDVFQTELTYPQEKGEVQLTLNPEFVPGDIASHISFPFVVEYGLTDSWQVGFNWNMFQQNFNSSGSASNGIGDLELETMYSFMNIGGSNFHAALGFEFGVPLGDEEKGIGENQWEYMPSISVARDFSSLNNAQLFMQAGIGFAQSKTDDDEPEGKELNLSGGLFVPFNKTVLTSELTWRSSKWDGGDENQLYLTPGIIFNLSGSREAGIAFPFGLNGESESFMILALLTFEFDISEEKE